MVAATPPRELVVLASDLVNLGERLTDFGNPNVISEVAAAAEAARAAAATARVKSRSTSAASDDSLWAKLLSLQDDAMHARINAELVELDRICPVDVLVRRDPTDQPGGEDAQRKRGLHRHGRVALHQQVHQPRERP